MSGLLAVYSRSPFLRSLLINRCIYRTMFYEPYRKGTEKAMEKGREWDDMTFFWQTYYGGKIFVDECRRWKEEVVEAFTMENRTNLRDPFVVDKWWEFKKPGVIDEWMVSKDADWDEGFSSATFERSPSGYGLFHGFLDCDHLPKDRTVTRVGWVNITGPCARRSFYRDESYDWSNYTHLVMRVRGDGRTYALIIRTPGSFDIGWFDLYSFGLYTHGGPYWQYVRIPFSRFVFTSKGSVQDTQLWMPTANINSFGISLMDKITGNFALEIDFVGLECDPTWNQRNIYEHYIIPEARFAQQA